VHLQPGQRRAITRASCTSADNTCLTPGEASAIQKIWGGARNASGKLLWPGVERGAALNGLGGASPFAIAVAQPRYWVYFDPTWDWTTLTYSNYEAFFKKTMQMVNPMMASESPDLSAFRNGGGKLVTWQGWADQLIMPQGSTMYYDAVTNFMGGGYAQTQQFFRHFMAPAVGHCGGGNGPQPQNLLQSVVDWVEQGVAPSASPRAGPWPAAQSDASVVPVPRGREVHRLGQHRRRGQLRLCGTLKTTGDST
jgi:hypothetical protein